jgi:tRNA wybutosine-synthesizing protein 3
MIKERDFIQNKKLTMQKLENAKKEKLVDEGIIPIIDIINSNENYYTSSSCYGRIVLLELPDLGDKKNAEFLGKWHRKINAKEVFLSLEKSSGEGQLWFLAQSPIIHVYAKDIDCADKLVKTTVNCGFKHSGFKTSEKNIIVEITSTERIDAPVGINGKLYCDKEYVFLLVDIANKVFEKSLLKLEKLKNALSQEF